MPKYRAGLFGEHHQAIALPLALTGWPLVRALGGFNLGVELGHAIAICLVLPIMAAIGHFARGVFVHRAASLAVAAAGAYWLFARVYLG